MTLRAKDRIVATLAAAAALVLAYAFAIRGGLCERLARLESQVSSCVSPADFAARRAAAERARAEAAAELAALAASERSGEAAAVSPAARSRTLLAELTGANLAVLSCAPGDDGSQSLRLVVAGDRKSIRRAMAAYSLGTVVSIGETSPGRWELVVGR